MNKSIPLNAGQLTAYFEPSGGLLREVCYQGIEVIHGVYVALRDHNWDTIEPVLKDLIYEKRKNGFFIAFRAECKIPGIDFHWNGQIKGTSQGVLEYTMDGLSLSTFRRNRIGFCVLHPATCAGLPCEVEHVDGTVERGSFPKWIAPHQPFKNIRSIRHVPNLGLSAKVRLEGDTFEMEDQRNWTDASFKTYCTPLECPFPVEVQSGSHVGQSITLSVQVNDPQVDAGESRVPLLPSANTVGSCHEKAVAIEIDSMPIPFPAIGLGVHIPGKPLSPSQRELFRLLAPAHLRFDVDFSRHNPMQAICQTLDAYADEPLFSADWQSTGGPAVGYEVALLLTHDAEKELRAVATEFAARHLPVARWLLFHHQEKSTSPRWLLLARQLLKKTFPKTPIYGGTNYYFAELNRQRPSTDAMDGLCYSINPQVHAFDDRSLLETLSIQAETLHSTKEFAAEIPIALSPITLLPRSNPNATKEVLAHDTSEAASIPADSRQMTQLAASWAAGSLIHLARSDVSSITYYELIGKRGVISERPSRLDKKTPTASDTTPSDLRKVYPLYHVLADVTPFCGQELNPCCSSDPLMVEAMLLKRPGRQRLLAVNLTPSAARVHISPLEGIWWKQQLDAASESIATSEPIRFRTHREQVTAQDQSITIELAPYAVLTLDRETS